MKLTPPEYLKRNTACDAGITLPRLTHASAQLLSRPAPAASPSRARAWISLIFASSYAPPSPSLLQSPPLHPRISFGEGDKLGPCHPVQRTVRRLDDHAAFKPTSRTDRLGAFDQMHRDARTHADPLIASDYRIQDFFGLRVHAHPSRSRYPASIKAGLGTGDNPGALLDARAWARATDNLALIAIGGAALLLSDGEAFPMPDIADMDGTQLAAHWRAVKRAEKASSAAPPATFETTPDGRATRRLIGGPRALNAQMVRMIGLMIHGHDWDPSKTPLGIYDAAAAVGYRRKAARHLARSRLFREAYRLARDGASNRHLVPTFDEVHRDVQRQDRDREVRAAPVEPKPAARPLAPAAGYVIRFRPVDTGATA
jgi:hypothetical protein